MKVTQLRANGVSVHLSFREIYVFLQCVAEASERMSGGDIRAIMNIEPETLEEYRTSLYEIKQEMAKLRTDND